MNDVLVIALVSKILMPLRVPTGQIFSHALGVLLQVRTLIKRCCHLQYINIGRLVEVQVLNLD